MITKKSARTGQWFKKEAKPFKPFKRKGFVMRHWTRARSPYFECEAGTPFSLRILCHLSSPNAFQIANSQKYTEACGNDVGITWEKYRKAEVIRKIHREARGDHHSEPC